MRAMAVTPVPAVLHYVGDESDNGGIMAVVRNLAAASHYSSVLGVSAGFKTRPDERLPVITFPSLPAEVLELKTFWRARVVATEAARWLEAWPERIFHAHTPGGLAVALWLRRRGQRRVLASVHCYSKRKWIYRWAARQLGDRLFWLSPAMKRYYGLKRPGDLWAQCVPGGVPLAETTELRRPVGGDRKIVHVGGVGPLVSSKCWHLVLDAMAAMPATQRWKIRFEHAGGADGTERSQRYQMALRAQTGALSLGNLVQWRGPEVRAEALLAEIDVLVVPSLREPFSLVMLEALAAGVPVLAANAGGARDVIASARNGWLFRSGDPRDLARALVMLAETDALATVSPRPESGWRFSSSVVAQQWALVYARVLTAT